MNKSSGLLGNASVLVVAQVVALCAPLITIPYIAGIFDQVTVGYFFAWVGIVQLGYVVVEFGFNVSGTTAIIKATSSSELHDFNFTALSSKLLLTVLYSLFVPLLVQLPGVGYWEVMIYSFLVIFFQALQPYWIYSAESRFTQYSFVQILAKSLYVLLVLYFVVSPNDMRVLIVIMVIGNAVQCFLMWGDLLVFRRELQLASAVRGKFCARYVIAGTGFFGARVGLHAPYFAGAAILAQLGTPVASAVFSVAETIARAARGLAASGIQVVLPRAISGGAGRDLFQFSVISSVLIIIGLIPGYFICEWFINSFYGDEYLDAVKVLAILLLAVPINYVGNLLGYPLFGRLERNNSLNILYVCVSFLFGMVLLFSFRSFESSAVTLALWLLSFEVVLLMARLMFYVRVKKLEFR